MFWFGIRGQAKQKQAIAPSRMDSPDILVTWVNSVKPGGKAKTERRHTVAPTPGAGGLQIQPVAALLALPVLVHIRILGQVHDFHKGGTGQLARSARGHVIRVTGDPKLLQTMATRQGHQKATGSGRIVVAPIGLFHAIANVSCVHQDVFGVAHP